MIQKEKIKKLVEDSLSDQMFLVDVKVSKTNVINVFIDGVQGISIEQCVALSRTIEANLDREAEDFELEVSSAGLGQPFKVLQQYYKNVGKQIEVILSDGQKLKGIMKEVSDAGINLLAESVVKAEGNKKKKLVVEAKNIEFKNIKSAKEIITF